MDRRNETTAGTFAQNALEWGVAGLNIDGGRIEASDNEPNARNAKTKPVEYSGNTYQAITRNGEGWDGATGRFPANLILTYPNDAHDADGNLLPNPGKDEVVGMFPVTKKTGRPKSVGNEYKGVNDGSREVYGQYEKRELVSCYLDEGSAARFFQHCPPDAKRVFYAAKASRGERNKGLAGMPQREAHKMSGGDCVAEGRTAAKGKAVMQNVHPTVKNLSLMRYLCTLTRTPTGGTVLDPFAGSGTTGVACVWTDRDFIGIEIDADYAEIAKRRINAALDEPKQGKLTL